MAVRAEVGVLGVGHYQPRYYNDYKLKRKGIFSSLVLQCLICGNNACGEDAIKRCQMIVGKKKNPSVPLQVDMSPDCREGSKQFKAPIEFQRRKENAGVNSRQGAMQLQGLPFPSVYRKVRVVNTEFLKPQLSGEINQSRETESREKSCALDQNKEEALDRTR